MRSTIGALLVLALSTTTLADELYLKTTIGTDSGAAEFWTCYEGIEDYVYDYTPLMLAEYSTYYDAMCGYPPAVATLLNCCFSLAEDKGDQFHDTVFKYAATSCKRYSSYHYSWTYYKDQYENGTKYYVPLDNIKNISLPLYAPTNANITAIEPTYVGYKNYYFNLDSGTWFSVGICGYFLLLIVISAIHNFSRKTAISKSINNSPFVKVLQKYIIFPTVLPNGKFAQAYGWKYFSLLFPNRIQFVTDLFIFALQVAFYCVDYRQNQGYWFGPARTTWQRFLGDRTGIMAFGKIPLLILFAGRNNFLLWITGWSAATFLHFHKVIASWMALDALIHSCAYTAYSKGSYVSSLKQTYFACGVAATVLCGVILLQAFHPFRVWYYEYFLTFHVVLAIAFLIMCWYHCNTLGWMEWLIAACCVWFFERLLRVIRMFGFGWKTATISVVDENLMKIKVPKPSWWFHQPGTYSYVYFAGWIFWENHPFTTVIEGDNLCSYIRVKKGITFRVWNQLVANGGKMNWKVCLEGPYGGDCASKLKKYDEALLIAGGSGVPSILENAAQVSKGKSIWIAQTLKSVQVYHNLLAQVHTEIEIYITREQGTDKITTLSELTNLEEPTTESSEKESDIEKTTSSGGVNIFYGRPNMGELLDYNVRNASANNIAIISCGPPALTDEVRNIVSSNVTSWDKSIDYFDELEVW